MQKDIVIRLKVILPSKLDASVTIQCKITTFSILSKIFEKIHLMHAMQAKNNKAVANSALTKICLG